MKILFRKVTPTNTENTGKVRVVAPAPRAAGVAVVDSFRITYLTGLMAVFTTGLLFSQEPLYSELQVNLNTYRDNFKVGVFYPSLSLTKKVTGSTSVNGKYLVDVITAASMRSRFEVDGITSATKNNHGGGDDTPDELRHEFGASVTQQVADLTLSVNGLYSTEHDYSSKTLIGNATLPLARNNTTLGLGITRSWDKIFPQIWDSTKTKEVLSIDISVSQVLSQKAITQLNAWYSSNKGLLSHPYGVVRYIEGNTLRTVEPAHPSIRNRQAIGSRTNVMLGVSAAVQLGYRFYWDSWEIFSHTLNITGQCYNKHRDIRVTAGSRLYTQGKACFFKPTYAGDEKYLSVDSKLDKSLSQEYLLKVTWLGQHFKDSFLMGKILKNSNSDLSASVKVYHRHTESKNWHSRRRDLLALLLGLGIRRRF